MGKWIGKAWEKFLKWIGADVNKAFSQALKCFGFFPTHTHQNIEECYAAIAAASASATTAKMSQYAIILMLLDMAARGLIKYSAEWI